MGLKKLTTESRVVLTALLITFIAAIVAYFMGSLSFAFGFIYGNAISAINFLLLSLVAKKCVQMDAEGAKLLAQSTYFGRMLFVGVAIVVLKFVPAINVWAAMLGFLPNIIAIYIEGLINPTDPKSPGDFPNGFNPGGHADSADEERGDDYGS